MVCSRVKKSGLKKVRVNGNVPIAMPNKSFSLVFQLPLSGWPFFVSLPPFLPPFFLKGGGLIKKGATAPF